MQVWRLTGHSPAPISLSAHFSSKLKLLGGSVDKSLTADRKCRLFSYASLHKAKMVMTESVFDQPSTSDKHCIQWTSLNQTDKALLGKIVVELLAASPLELHDDDTQQVRPVLGHCNVYVAAASWYTRHMISVSATPCSQPLCVQATTAAWLMA